MNLEIGRNLLTSYHVLLIQARTASGQPLFINSGFMLAIEGIRLLECNELVTVSSHSGSVIIQYFVSFCNTQNDTNILCKRQFLCLFLLRFVCFLKFNIKKKIFSYHLVYKNHFSNPLCLFHMFNLFKSLHLSFTRSAQLRFMEIGSISITCTSKL